MSTPPIGNQAARAVVQNGLSKTALGLFTLGALGFSAWRIQDSYTGSQQKALQRVSALKEENDYNYAEYGWGHWSGNPGLDQLGHKFQGLMMYGPHRIRENYKEAKIRVSSFFTNVLYPNLIPLGVGLAGLYSTIGHKKMTQYANDFVKWWKQSGFFSQYFNPTMKAVGKIIWDYGSKGISTAVRQPFKSPAHFAVGSGIALTGAFFLRKFIDAYGHDGQRDFFRDDIYAKEEPEI